MMRFCVLALCGVCVLFLGCNSQDTGGRLPVSGKVTLKGDPLKSGTIEFDSPDSRSGASIVDGEYTIPAPQGLTPGKYTVRVSSIASSQATPAMPGESAPIEKANQEQIPAEYNTKSTQTYEAGSSKDNTFNLDIP